MDTWSIRKIAATAKSSKSYRRVRRSSAKASLRPCKRSTAHQLLPERQYRVMGLQSTWQHEGWAGGLAWTPPVPLLAVPVRWGRNGCSQFCFPHTQFCAVPSCSFPSSFPLSFPDSYVLDPVPCIPSGCTQQLKGTACSAEEAHGKMQMCVSVTNVALGPGVTERRFSAFLLTYWDELQKVPVILTLPSSSFPLSPRWLWLRLWGFPLLHFCWVQQRPCWLGTNYVQVNEAEEEFWRGSRL